jgi:hypothetical protein
MNPRNPPLSPLVDNRKSKFVFQVGKPINSACNRYTIIYISFSYPNPQSSFNENGIEPITSVSEHGVIGRNIITTGLEELERDMELSLNRDFIKEMTYSIQILTDYVISHRRG